MKSKLNTQQENNFRRVSKLSFILFGILLALMSTSAFANESIHETSVVTETSIVLAKPSLVVEADTIISIGPNLKKLIVDVIKEDNLIIESTISNEVINGVSVTALSDKDNLILSLGIFGLGAAQRRIRLPEELILFWQIIGVKN